MKIGFLVEVPTQFEAPFYRHAASSGGADLRVLFLRENAAARFDPELGHDVAWGIDLTGGYDHAFVPRSGGLAWLRNEIATQKYDLLIVNGYTRWPYLAAAFLAASRGCGTGLRTDSVAFAEERSGIAKSIVFRALLLPLFGQFFAVGSETKSYLRSYGVPDSRIAFFSYAVDVDWFRKRARLDPAERAKLRRQIGITDGATAVLTVAKHHARETPWDAVEALGLLGRDSGFELLLVGDGPDRSRLEQRVGENGRDRVKFLGYLPYPELPRLYAASDIFVHAAREERWGVSVAEALACGLPVIASSRVGAAFDLLSSGKNGFIYESGDAASLARCLGRCRAELAPEAVAEENRRILSEWDYAATWRSLVAAVERVSNGAAR